MGSLLLVRHGQASFLSDDYDRLSSIGERQAERLGAYWSRIGFRCDAVYHGPARRHAGTGEIVASAFRRAGQDWPEARIAPEFDEYQAFELIRYALPQLREQDEAIRRMEERFREETDPLERSRAFERLFQRITRMWVQGEVLADGVEPWQAFVNRVGAGLRNVREGAGKGSCVVVFTSGGPIAAAAGLALDLSPVKTLELSWASRNGGYSEFLFSEDRFSLASFNTHPHLDDDGLLTWR